MRLLRNVLLMAIPIVIVITMYQFLFNGGQMEEFRGMSYLYTHISSFPGLDFFINTLEQIGVYAERFSDYASKGNVIDLVFNFFSMVGMAFFVPISLVVCVIQNILWFINMVFVP